MRLALLLLLLITLVDGAPSSVPPPVLYMPLYQGYFVSVQVGSESSSKLLRIRFDCDYIAVYGAPAGGTYNQVDGTDIIALAPAIWLRMPMLYTYQGDPRVSDPIATNMRVTYQGVFGLGPGSPVWTWYDAWTLERAQLVLGIGIPAESAIKLPPSVRIAPQQDYSTIRDLELFLRWASMIQSSETEDIGAAMQLYQAAAGRPVQSNATRQLNQLARIVVLDTHNDADNSSSRVQRTMLVPLSSDNALDIQAYATDSTSGNEIELVRFEAPNITSLDRAKRRARMLADDTSDDGNPALDVGLVHARDHNIGSDASQTLVLISVSPSGPFRPSQIHYTWLFLACLLVSLTHVPGLSEVVHRAQLLYMPMAQPSERAEEIANARQDWTMLHLVSRWVLICAIWVMQASFVAARSLRDLNTVRGAVSGQFAYYGTIAYTVVVLLFGPARYPDHRSVARFMMVFYLCGTIILTVHFEDYTNVLIVLMLVWLGYRIIAAMNIDDWMDDDTELTNKQRWLTTALLSTVEMLFVGWFAAFYVTDALLRTMLPQIPLAVLIETMALVTIWMRFVFIIANRARAANLQANAQYLARKLADQLDEALKIDATQQTKLVNDDDEEKTATATSRVPSAPITVQSSLAQYHLGMAAASSSPLDSVNAV